MAVYVKQDGALLTPRTYRENRAAMGAYTHGQDPDVAIVKARYRGPKISYRTGGIRGILEQAYNLGLVQARSIWISAEDDGVEWTLPSGKQYRLPE